MKKVRVNVVIDEKVLEKTKSKIHFFGGKLSTLIEVLLKDFLKSAELSAGHAHNKMEKRIKDLERRVKKLEKIVKS